MSNKVNFYEFWKAAKPDKQFSNRFPATAREWNRRTAAAQQAMFKHVTTQGGLPPERNPYFFVLDFTEPKPYNWNGDRRIGEMVEKGLVASAKYGDKWGMYSIEDIVLFGMEGMVESGKWKVES